MVATLYCSFREGDVRSKHSLAFHRFGDDPSGEPEAPQTHADFVRDPERPTFGRGGLHAQVMDDLLRQPGRFF
jgi:hypothetical protein